MKPINSKQIKIAARYARALSKFDECDKIYAELVSVKNILDNSTDLKNFLESPIISINDKKDVVKQVFATFSEKIINFLMILIDKNRFACFESILSELKSDIDKMNNIMRVEVVSAISLTEEEKSRIKNCLEKKLQGNIEADYLIDKSIVAGLVVKIGDKVVDNSLKSQFDGMKKQLIK